jgi:hypothetical protein
MKVQLSNYNGTDMRQQDLDAIIQAGEGYQVEFKRNVNSDISRVSWHSPTHPAEGYS